MKDWDKMAELCELLEEDATEFARNRGGYPDEIRWLPGDPGYLVIASVESDEPHLSVFKGPKCLQWLKDIRASQKDEPGEDLFYHINETRPEED